MSRELSASDAGLASSKRRDWFWGVALVLAIVATYQPVWRAGFIWDDTYHVTTNPCIVGPLGLKEIWFTDAGRLFPLTFTTFWFEHALWGLAPLPYHLVNVALHAACAVALWQVLRALRVPGAWLGAALWALHPVQVESVAWISELKNTQSTLFYLLTIYFFLRWLDAGKNLARGQRDYILTLLCVILAMLSKTATLVLPGVLQVCAWWMDEKGDWRRLMRVLLPVALLALAAGLWTVWPRAKEAAALADPLFARSWPQRCAGAGDALWFYLGKLLWPHPLMAIYPRWQIDAGQVLAYVPLLAAVAVTLILWLKRNSGLRPIFFVWIYFLVTLAPFLGLLEQSFWHYSLVEDHLQYLAAMGPLALIGAGLARLADGFPSQLRRLPAALGAVLLVTLALLSWARAGVFVSDETLWTDNLAKNPQCWAGYNNLGHVFFERGQLDDAIAEYQKSLALYPTYDLAHLNLGVALGQKGKLDEAMSQYQQALAINPQFDLAHNDLGSALLQKGQLDEAMAQFQAAIAINPTFGEAHYNLGGVLVQKGRVDEAIAQFQAALASNPNVAEVHFNLGKALVQKGRVDEALDEFQQASEIDPQNAEAHYNLGSLLAQQGRLDEAIAELQKAVACAPQDVEAHYNLASLLLQQGRKDEAIAEYQATLALKPNLAEACNGLGVALLKSGRVDEALAQLQKAVEINPALAEAHGNLGAALLQKGRINEAVAQFQEVVRLKPDSVAAQQVLARVQALARQPHATP